MYTEEELKAWFEYMKKEYPNSKMLEHVEMIEYVMFDKYANEKDKLKNFVKRLDKPDTL